jgi:broad specificity phosphatase PhoE
VSAHSRWFDLLRHGEAAGGSRYRGHTDDPLTPAGWQQMHDAVAHGDWDRIVTSPLVRCHRFALTLAEARKLPLEVDPRLREMDFGAWEGRTAESLMAQEPEALLRFWNDPLSNPPPGGESLVAFSERVLGAWREHASRLRAERVLMVTHGGPIRLILGHLAGSAPAELIAIPVPLASINRITVSPAGVAVAIPGATTLG